MQYCSAYTTFKRFIRQRRGSVAGISIPVYWMPAACLCRDLHAASSPSQWPRQMDRRPLWPACHCRSIGKCWLRMRSPGCNLSPRLLMVPVLHGGAKQSVGRRPGQWTSKRRFFHCPSSGEQQQRRGWWQPRRDARFVPRTSFDSSRGVGGSSDCSSTQ